MNIFKNNKMNILEKITENNNKQIYYNFMCDDRRATNLENDYSFGLYEVDKLIKLLDICNKNHYKYILEINEWNEIKQEIVSTIKIIDNN